MGCWQTRSEDAEAVSDQLFAYRMICHNLNNSWKNDQTTLKIGNRLVQIHKN